MIRFIQSYAAPGAVNEPIPYKVVAEHFHGQTVYVPFYDNKVRNLTNKEVMKFGFKNYDEACDGDTLFGWGTDIVLYSWLKNKLLQLVGGGVRN